MNTPLSFLRNAIVLTLAAFAASQANAAQDAVTMTVDDTAPLHATLLPTVSVTGDSANPYAEPRMSVASAAPLGVTLLPGVHVTASAPELAAVTLPLVRVVAHAYIEPKADAVAYRVNDDGSAVRMPRAEGATAVEHELPLRARVLPR
ncbi:MAG TPA: hypothetical protein VGC55_00685 [Dokdonella sp.]